MNKDTLGGRFAEQLTELQSDGGVSVRTWTAEPDEVILFLKEELNRLAVEVEEMRTNDNNKNMGRSTGDSFNIGVSEASALIRSKAAELA